MPAPPDDPVREHIQRALEAVATKDDSLAGAQLGRWFVIAEHEWPAGGSTLSAFRSQNLPPWDAIGLLEFIRAMEQASTEVDVIDEDDD